MGKQLSHWYQGPEHRPTLAQASLTSWLAVSAQWRHQSPQIKEFLTLDLLALTEYRHPGGLKPRPPPLTALRLESEVSGAAPPGGCQGGSFLPLPARGICCQAWCS